MKTKVESLQQLAVMLEVQEKIEKKMGGRNLNHMLTYIDVDELSDLIHSVIAVHPDLHDIARLVFSSLEHHIRAQKEKVKKDLGL